MKIHQLAADEALCRLQSELFGLSVEQTARRMIGFGPDFSHGTTGDVLSPKIVRLISTQPVTLSIGGSSPSFNQNTGINLGANSIR
jgi:hypothetical protein